MRESAYAHGVFVFPDRLPHGLADELCATALPVPATTASFADPLVRSIVEDVLAGEKIRLADLRVRQMRG